MTRTASSSIRSRRALPVATSGGFDVAAPTKNQALAALRHFFDALVTRHAVALNPFASVRGVKHHVIEGKTPEISIAQARALRRLH